MTFACAAKPASPSAGGAAVRFEKSRLRGLGFDGSMDKTLNSTL
jgi:hypothetical protein